MFKIATLNKISKKGLDLLDEKYITTTEIEEADGILVRSQDMHSMEFSDTLEAIARAGAGVNNIPLEKCADKGIVVFNTPGANANAVKELVIAGLFLAARNIPAALSWASSLEENVSQTVEKGKSQFAGTEILGKTLGVIGLGAIGKKVAGAAKGLGMDICGYDPYYTGTFEEGKFFDNLPEMLPLCDYITIHVPATDSTKGMFNKDLFALMKDNVVILNFSRDKLVKDVDLLVALENNKIATYVTDFPNDALIDNEKVILLPHLGASTEEAEENCAVMAVNQMMDFLENGNIVNSVNFPALNMGPIESGVRFAFFTKDCADPVALVESLLKEAEITPDKIEGATRGAYGYVLAEAVMEDAHIIVAHDNRVIKQKTFEK